MTHPRPDRPDPEHFLGLIRSQQRGKLKVYLGFAPGVGKTYGMLLEGQRLKKQGIDVVIGIIETHGRADTSAQLSDLEIVPRRIVEYRGVQLEELDLLAVLHRKPTVVLVDELAHTNAPGSKNSKRYQDVDELLRAGIHVITTLNIQHIESLYDVIEQFTGVKVKERIPDHVLAQADQIVNVDVAAEDLQERLRQGKVYPQERVERALHHFFTEDNLSRLRELTLEEIASALDRQRQQQAGVNVNASDRVMVCLSSGSPNVHRLFRKAARLADRYNAPLLPSMCRHRWNQQRKWMQPGNGRLPKHKPWLSNWALSPCSSKALRSKPRWHLSWLSTTSPISCWGVHCDPGISAGSGNLHWSGCYKL
jgi:two-component system sensor histidine kinase KdpD